MAVLSMKGCVRIVSVSIADPEETREVCERGEEGAGDIAKSEIRRGYPYTDQQQRYYEQSIPL